MPAMLMAHTTDPKQELLKKIGNLDDYELFHNQVLVAVYLRPKVTASGIHLPDSHVDEDRHQSKVGVIVKTGPRAFKSEGEWTWPEDMSAGDWVFFRVSDGWDTVVNGVLCRIMDDFRIRGRVQHVDQVF